MRWERPTGVSDPAGDADADGLTEAAELEATTDPRSSDTDGGGEADGSELAAGRDPRDPSDDTIAAPDLRAPPGNALVYRPGGMDLEDAALLTMRAASRD